MTAKYRDLAMMFSGGLDTTLAAARLLESGDVERLHLLTFCNGFCVGVGHSGFHVGELRRIHGADRVLHEIIYVTEIFEELRSPVLDLVRKWGSTLAVDLCCRLSFETAAIIYCINNGIADLCDGTNIDQGRLFLEKPEYLRVSREYFAEHGIHYFSPVYGREGGRKGRMDALKQRGLSVGPRFLEKVNITSSILYQPFCLFAIHTFFFTSFLRDAPLLKHVIARYNLPVETAVAARLDRQQVARRIIAQRTAAWTPEEAAAGVRIDDKVCTTRLCGLNGVEVALPRGVGIDIGKLEQAWVGEGRVSREGDTVRLRTGDGVEVQATARGRVLVNGLKDRGRVLDLYRRYVASNDVLSASQDSLPEVQPAQ